MMSEKEFIEMLKNSNISYVKIIHTLDWTGHETNLVYFNEEAKNYKLEEFDYLEFEGDFDKAVENYTKEFYEEYKSDGMTMCESLPLWFIIKEELFVMGL